MSEFVNAHGLPLMSKKNTEGVVVYPSAVHVIPYTVPYRQLNLRRRLNGVSCSIMGRDYRLYPIIDDSITTACLYTTRHMKRGGYN
jgi:hypothetical protein